MDNISPLTSDFKGQELKKKLLECLDKEAREFSAVARNYFSKGQLSKEDKLGLLHAVIHAVDHVIAAGDWSSSLFLKNTIKPLIAIKAEAETEINILEEKVEKKAVKITPPTEDEVDVYISLFQSDGYNINKWAMQLRSLDRYTVGRPVYQSEADVQKRIRLRSAAAGNEGYVIVTIRKADIQSPDPFASPLKDQFDHPLLVLKEIAVRNGRIVAFVHQGICYHFVDGQLIKQG
ncbi:MAG: Dot/Icm secretion system protein IcmQ [Gammaproteobacteria bacterium CG_4_10_14_0_8_um_filter_38_16]|nr:MAG: Dot/Icm secretion system protein IcmQ [Gammaproteobacteria bacterium CG_4_10_14_0_8_um_filter_38_16]PJA04406.1 MAG: Dot/Icm secretion system protein IcmQ [Gammaproteobacteria bacterium CG_4_10_14_0_2_um_filter_38_22]PJB10173.1 MAG: Dot/Icm secretion system protein IcmQ [Gammaproteobacteria bacterium CG_4_9_14_3_um_filter_38_9]